MPASYWVLLLAGVMLSAVAGILLKLGSMSINYQTDLLGIVLQVATNWRIIGGMLFYFIPVLIWIFMLKKIDLSYLQPLFSMMYVATPLLSMFFLDEHVPLMRWMGIAVVAFGVVIIAKS